MKEKHFSHLESIENSLESANSTNGLFNPSEIPNLIESHSSKSVTITLIDPGGSVSHIVGEAKFGKESHDPQTTYLVIPTSAARDARYGSGSVTGCEDLNVDAIQGVQVDFAEEGSFDSLETSFPRTFIEPRLCSTGSIEAAGDIFSDAFDTKSIHTIECYDTGECLSNDSSKSTSNFRRNNHDCPGVACSNGSNSDKSSKVEDNVATSMLCLVCAKNLSNLVEAMFVSSCTMTSTKRPATTLLAKTLGDPLSIFTKPGCVLCRACFRLLELVDTLEHRLHRTTTLLLTQYWPKQKHFSTKQLNHPSKTTSRTDEPSSSVDPIVSDIASFSIYNAKKVALHEQKKLSSPFTLVSNPALRKREKGNVLNTPSCSKSSYSAAAYDGQNDSEALASVKLAGGDGPDYEYEAETVIKIEERDTPEDEADGAATSEMDSRQNGLDRRKRGRPRKSRKNIKCNFCQKLFRPKYYRVHLNTHTHELQFPCPGCSLVFYSSSSLLSHYRRNHADPTIKKFRCPMCAKGFIYSREMERHVNTVHKNLRQFDCKVCQSSFKHVAHLNYHMRSHTGEKPNCCDVCSRRFRRPGELKNHVIKVHGMQYRGKYRERLGKAPPRADLDEEGTSGAMVVTVGTSDPDLFK